MDSQLITHIQKLAQKETSQELPDVKTGMHVEVSQRIVEWDKSRTQKFEGVVIRTGGKTNGEKTFTVRRVTGWLGIEKTFPISSPTLENVEIKRQYKVRRKNIRFIRNLTGKAARLKEVK